MTFFLKNWSRHKQRGNKVVRLPHRCFLVLLWLICLMLKTWLLWPLILTPVDQYWWMLAGNVRYSPANFGTSRLSHKQEVYASDSQMCMCSSEVVYVEKVVCWELWSFEHQLDLLFSKYLNAKFTTWHEFFHSCWVVWWLSGSRHDQLKVSSF